MIRAQLMAMQTGKRSQSSIEGCWCGWADCPTILLVYALTSWTHSPASSLQEYPAAQDIACKLDLFLEAQPSPQANELVAVMIKTNALVTIVFITLLLRRLGG